VSAAEADFFAWLLEAPISRSRGDSLFYPFLKALR